MAEPMPAPPRLLLVAIVAFALGACAAPGTGPDAAQPIRFDTSTPTAEMGTQAERQAAEEAKDAALRAASPLADGTTAATFTVDGDDPARPDEVDMARDADGRVRRISTTVYTAGPRSTRTHTTHWLDATGGTVGVGHVYQIAVPGSCRRASVGWFVDLLLDGAGGIVSVQQRLPPTNESGEAECAPPRPPDQTVLVHPTVETLLASLGVADLNALPWDDSSAPMPVPPPPPPRSN